MSAIVSYFFSFKKIFIKDVLVTVIENIFQIFGRFLYLRRSLTLIWVGFLGVRFEGGVKITPCLKPVRIMLETSNLACQDALICNSRKYTFKCLGPLNFADVSIFFLKKLAFFAKKSTFMQSNSVRAALEIF